MNSAILAATRLQRMTDAVDGIPVTVPSGFTFTPPFNITKNGSIYTTDFNVDDYDFSPTATVTYYFSPSGLDINNGLTPATPKLLMQPIIVALNAAPPANGAAFYIMGDYLNSTQLPNTSPTFNLAIKGYNDIKYKLSARDIAPLYNAIGNNTYSWIKAVSPVAMFVIDETDLDVNGIPKRMTLLASQAAVESSPTGSVYFRDAATNTVYFKLWDLRAADSNVKAYVNDSMPAFVSKNIYIENIIFDSHGAVSINPSTGNSPAIFCLNNVDFIHSTGNGLTLTAGPTDNIILKSCSSFQNAQDGMDYGKRGGDVIGPNVIEISCIANNNGYGSGVSENGSTTHDSTSILRINGTYVRNKNRNIHDVNANFKTWMVSCLADDAQNKLLAANSIDFGAGIEGVATAGGVMWLDGCTSNLTSLRQLLIAPSAVVRYRNMDLTGWQILNQGTLETY
jgi:hypothetical protein